jgi:hypothetical protein
MADRVLFMSWRTVARGREERALEVFNEALGLYGRMQQDGRIERFDVVLLEPNGELGGYMELHGSSAQLAAVREADDFRRTIVDAQLAVEGMRLVDGATDAGLAREIQRYQEGIAALPERV